MRKFRYSIAFTAAVSHIHFSAALTSVGSLFNVHLFCPMNCSASQTSTAAAVSDAAISTANWWLLLLLLKWSEVEKLKAITIDLEGAAEYFICCQCCCCRVVDTDATHTHSLSRLLAAVQWVDYLMLLLSSLSESSALRCCTFLLSLSATGAITAACVCSNRHFTLCLLADQQDQCFADLVVVVGMIDWLFLG